MPMTDARRSLVPAPTLPLVYFAIAHVALAIAAAALVVAPDLPGAFHYHPRMIAVIHLVTLGWITASILGAFYIVAPLAFGMPFAPGAADRWACLSFWLGTAGMVWGFWRADYQDVGIASTAVLAGILVVALRAWRGLASARLPFGVSLHVALAFVNVLVAGSLGLVLALARVSGVGGWSPLALAVAHAHLAVLGWGVMMILGVSYRLVPMFLPAAMPGGGGLAWSAVLLQVGTLGVATTLAQGYSVLPWTLVVLAAFAAFLRQVRGILANRRPRPAVMVGRDWSTWQTHGAMLYLIVAAAAALWMLLAPRPASSLSWIYGLTGVIGFVAQMVVGIQGRLLPLHAWYRAMASLDGEPPPRAVHVLADGRLALAIFLLWSFAVPGLAAGLMVQSAWTTAGAAALLLVSTAMQAWHLGLMVRRARLPLPA